MRTRFISKAALLCAVLLGFAAPCPASEAPAVTPDSIQTAQPEEAVIVSINRNKVTLQSITNAGKITTITSDTTEGLKAGDRVTLVGTTLKKSELPAPQHFKGGETSPSSSAAPTSGNKS